MAQPVPGVLIGIVVIARSASRGAAISASRALGVPRLLRSARN